MTKDFDPVAAFDAEIQASIAGYPKDSEWQKLNIDWMYKSFQHKHMYNFRWMGRPIIQYPMDMVALQEIIWDVRPDLIVETGIAHGGSVVYSASLLAMLDMCDCIESGEMLDPATPKRKVVGIDIDIREHNRKLIETHPMHNRMHLIEGSSIDEAIVDQVKEFAKDYSRILVCMDSNHTHEHVSRELNSYAPLVSKGSYCIVFDTLVDDLPEDTFPDRPWAPGNNPKTAVREYLENQDTAGRMGVDGQPLCFEVDQEYNNKLMISVAPEGYLVRI